MANAGIEKGWNGYNDLLISIIVFKAPRKNEQKTLVYGNSQFFIEIEQRRNEAIIVHIKPYNLDVIQYRSSRSAKKFTWS